MATPRFTKAQAILDLQARADKRQAEAQFDLKDGTSQLLPKGADEKLKALIQRAVAYGYMSAYVDAARDIEGGYIGVATK